MDTLLCIISRTYIEYKHYICPVGDLSHGQYGISSGNTRYITFRNIQKNVHVYV